jgi:hypothetical protein
MRSWGTVLLVSGSVFMALFVAAELVKARVGFSLFLISSFLIVVGWTLRNSGMGIVQSNPAPSPSQTPQQAHATPDQLSVRTAQFPTIELSLTPEVAALIAQQGAGTKRFVLYLSGGCIVLFILLAAGINAMEGSPGGGHDLFFFFCGVGVFCSALMYGISWLTTQKPVRRDLGGATYLRTTGPVQVVRIGGGAMLRLADRAFLMKSRRGMAELKNLSWGSVDYSPHGHVILGAWDREGRPVYCLPGYDGGAAAAPK